MKCLLQGQEMSLIKKMELEALKFSGVVSLAQGIPWYPIPEGVLDFLIQKIQKGQTNRYSIVPGIPELRELIAHRYYKQYKININSQNEVIITAGAIQAITALLLTVVEVNDEVILIDPSYASYNGCIKVARGVPIYVPLDDQLDLDVSTICATINSKTKVILLANPNNPTGSIFSYNKIIELLDFIKDKDILLVLDEVYDEFIFTGEAFVSAASLYEKYRSNLVIINSWSKTFGMTGWRVGYLIANSSLFAEILKIHDSMITCAPVHSQRAAIATFDIYEDWVPIMRKQIQIRKDYTVEQLSKLANFIEFQIPKATYYIFPKFKYTNADYQECMKILQEKKVVLVPGSGFGFRGQGHFRICFGRDLHDLQVGFQRLYDYFHKI